ncbi:hypothetical protein C8R47DRAFT_760771 [Mycena vitilis]|nr:hypothetical protein C8R47DRAFT_760771 [Mycena vitilis]
MAGFLSTNIYCVQCDIYFIDVQARLEHIEASLSHPSCETCCRRFLNQNSLSLHMKCSTTHLCPGQKEEELLDGDDVLIAWSTRESVYNSTTLKDYWSSQLDSDSDGSTSDSEPDLTLNSTSKTVRSYRRGPNQATLHLGNFVNSSANTAMSEKTQMALNVSGHLARRCKVIRFGAACSAYVRFL